MAEMEYHAKKNEGFILVGEIKYDSIEELAKEIKARNLKYKDIKTLCSFGKADRERLEELLK